MAGLPAAVRGAIRRFIREENAQELVEYALLGVSIGLGSVVAIRLLLPIMGSAYAAWIGNVNAISATPAPAGS